MTTTFPKLAEDDLPTDRRFGQVFTVIFLGIGTYWGVTGWLPGAVVALSAGGGIALATWLRPSLLHGPNRAWAMLGLLLGKVMGTVVLGMIFLIVITPLATLFRLTGRDELRLKRSAAATYWRPRDTTQPVSGFRDQF